ncbi:TetR/AcrR family transcriptional regulator [Novosphingobium jiangmenense]|nr:TetR/AcrR family transcriptional regulator [Novosphingobium jiangmenense]
MPPRVAHLLEVARAEFVAEGFDGVSIDAIARKGGVSKETIYRHFPDKQALFTASLEEMANHFTARAEAIVRSGHASAMPAAEELAGLAEAILDAACGGGLLSPSWLAAGLGTRLPAFAAELQAAQAARMEPVREALADIARSKGLARAISIDDALDFGSLSVEGSALLMGFAPPPAERRKVLVARVAALFEHGVLALPPGTPVPERASEAAAKAPPGREHPTHLRRLLEVAAEHFLREGFEAASLGEIGAEAKVGRGTLYRHFASKAGLFDAVLRHLAAQVAETARPPELPASADVRSMADYLAQATLHLTGPASVALHRVAISASRREPALARTVHDTVRAPWVGPLAEWITRLAGHPDADWLARQGVVLAMQGNRAISAGGGPQGDALSAHALRAAKLFLHGLGG